MTIEERNKLLEEIQKLGLVENYAKKLCNSQDFNQFDDVIQELWLQLCEIPCEKWVDLLEQGTNKDRLKAVRGYISGVLHRSIRSNSSRLYNKLKKHQKYEYMEDDNTWLTLNEIADNNMLSIDMIYAEEAE